MVAQVSERVEVVLPRPHKWQREVIESTAKRVIVRAGRRGGKTVGAAIKAVQAFLVGKRVLYATPTGEQMGKFWYEVSTALEGGVRMGVLKKNESESYIEKVGTQQRIKAKTAWNADTLRGDFADLLILDEWQLMNEDTWELVGAPMLLDKDGDALFIYTPPSLRTTGVSKARDPRHAAKMFSAALEDKSGRWQAVHFTSHDNPYISQVALSEITKDMSREAYRHEILAEDDDVQGSWLVYKAFNEAVCKIRRFQVPENWDVWSGHDFGSANPAALFFAKAQLPLPVGAPPYMRMGDLVCFKEYLPGGGSAPVHVQAFKEITAGHKNIRSVGGNVTTEEQTRQLYGMHGWSIEEPLITRVNAQIERVIGLMELNKVYVFEDCFFYLEELMNCLWKLDVDGRTTDKVKDEAKYHLASCARYVLSGFRPETASSNRPETKHSKWSF